MNRKKGNPKNCFERQKELLNGKINKNKSYEKIGFVKNRKNVPLFEKSEV